MRTRRSRRSIRPYPTWTPCIETARSEQADLAVAKTFITWERDQDFDSSFPVLEAGQQVKVCDTGPNTEANSLLGLLNLLISQATLIWPDIALLFILISAHVAWFLEGGRDDGVIPSKSRSRPELAR